MIEVNGLAIALIIGAVIPTLWAVIVHRKQIENLEVVVLRLNKQVKQLDEELSWTRGNLNQLEITVTSHLRKDED